MAKKLFFIFLLTSVTALATAQGFGVIQFSGEIRSADTLHKAIPFVTVYDFRTGIITISNYEGFFSLVAMEGDTVQFSCLGFKRQWFIIPAGLPDKKFAIKIYLEPTFMMLKEQVVYPWGTRDQFPEAFVHTPIPDDDLVRAKRNLNPDVIRAMISNAPADPNINSQRVLSNYTSSLYYYGQPRPISLLNPIAWSQFINDIRNGRYKNPNK